MTLKEILLEMLVTMKAHQILLGELVEALADSSETQDGDEL